MAKIGYGYGSEWHLLQHFGRRREAFTRRVAEATGCQGIHWLDHDERRKNGALRLIEVRGLDFLPQGHPARKEWERLWPQSGNVPNWDAVGRAGEGPDCAWLLLEAKAHVGEFVSSCGAESPDSVDSIRRFLDSARAELGVDGGGNWMTDHYQ